MLQLLQKDYTKTGGSGMKLYFKQWKNPSFVGISSIVL